MAGRTDLEQLQYQMSADIRQLISLNKKALTNVDETANAAQRRYDRLAAEMGRDFGKVSLAAGVAFGAIVGYATRAASEASETANAFQVAFGDLTDQANKFATSYSKDVGRALDETQANMARTQLILTGVGVSADQALGMTEQIQRRAIDIGSLFNVEDAEAYQAILSGIAGEAEPLKKFGVAVNEAATKAELLKLGFKGNAEQAPEAAKAIARLNIILAQSSKADGDAIRTKDGLANSTKAAQAEFRNAAVELGQNFLPTAAKVTHATAEMLGEFNRMPDSVKLAGLGLLGLVAAGGPIVMVLEGLGKIVKAAAMARAALSTVAGGAGLTGGVLAGTGLAVAASTYNNAKYRGTLRNVGSATDAEIAAAQEYARNNVKAYEADPNANNAGRVNDLLAKYRSELKALNDEAAKRSVQAAADFQKEVQAATDTAPGGFTLSPNLMNPVGGSKAKTGKTAAQKAADLARDQADRTNADLARAKDEELRAQQSLGVSIRERAQIELDRLAADREARKTDLDLSVQDKKITEAQRKAIDKAEARARAAEEKAIIEQRDRDLAAEALRQREAIADLQAQALSIEGNSAKTIFERLQVEGRILAIRQRMEQEALEAELANNKNLTDQQKDAIRDAQFALQTAQLKGLKEGAKEQLKSGILEGLEAARGGADSFADFLGNKLRAKLMDRLADLFAKLVLEAGGGGGVIGGVARFFAGFFASGGTIPAGQWGVVNDGGPEAIRAKPGGGVEVMSNKGMRALSAPEPAVAAQGLRGDVKLNVTVYADGAIPREEIETMVQRGSLQAVAAARALSTADQARARRTARMQTLGIG